MTYEYVRNKYLSKPENKFCRIFCGKLAVEVHHVARRVGYADQFARDNDIPLLIDVRYFMAVSREGHNWIHEDEVRAEKLGYIKRIH